MIVIPGMPVIGEHSTPSFTELSVGDGLAGEGTKQKPLSILASQAEGNLLTAALSADEVRPLTDKVTVMAADIVPFTVDADIVMPSGPDNGVIMDSAAAALDVYLNSVRRVGSVVARSGIDRALHQDGVVRVVLRAPAADMTMQRGQAPHCTAINLNRVLTSDE